MLKILLEDINEKLANEIKWELIADYLTPEQQDHYLVNINLSELNF